MAADVVVLPMRRISGTLGEFGETLSLTVL